jgi:hypothetical protein
VRRPPATGPPARCPHILFRCCLGSMDVETALLSTGRDASTATVFPRGYVGCTVIWMPKPIAISPSDLGRAGRGALQAVMDLWRVERIGRRMRPGGNRQACWRSARIPSPAAGGVPPRQGIVRHPATWQQYKAPLGFGPFHTGSVRCASAAFVGLGDIGQVDAPPDRACATLMILPTLARRRASWDIDWSADTSGPLA